MNRLSELWKFLAPEFVYGVGALELAGRFIESLGATKVLIVTDPGVRTAGWTSKVEANVKKKGIEFVVFDQVTPNPKDHEVMAGLEIYTEKKCDFILAVGGGSPTDCAKGIGICAANDEHILKFEGINAVPAPGPPIVCVPTTAGTAADLSQFAIITDTVNRRKITIISKTIVPDASLIDPLTTTTMPPELTAATGMDVLCHAFEAYVSNLNSPVTDLNALEAVRLTSTHLAGAYAHPENMAYRHGMMTANLMAGLAFSNASLGLTHAMAHSLGGLLDLPHGLCNAILLEHVVRYNYEAVPDRYAQLAENLGVDVCALTSGQILDALTKRLAALRQAVGMNPKQPEVRLEKGVFGKLAELALSDACLATNPRTATLEDIERIYENAFSGDACW